jgi:DNA (cytosine-5)-methyltransferase 1
MTHLDLCTGIGGFHIAAEWAGFETMGFSEIEPYCCQLKEKWPGIKNYGDLRTADFSGLRGRVTVLTAGVPCQPASLAGKRGGSKDDRWLWPAVLNAVGSINPAWCIFENPPGILSLGEFETVLLRLGDLGYEVRLFSVPANAVGADHLRHRIFIVANASGRRCDRQGEGENQQSRGTEVIGASKAVSDSTSDGLEGGQQQNGALGSSAIRQGGMELAGGSKTMADAEWGKLQRWREPGDMVSQASGIKEKRDQRERRRDASIDSREIAPDTDIQQREERNGKSHRSGIETSFWDDASRCVLPTGFRITQSPLCRRTDGIPNRSHRLKALGNSVVPAQCYPFFKAIYDTEKSFSK